MFCPQCGTESISDLKFCRACGANLKVIGKAVTLSEAIARSDSVPNKIKDLVKSLKIERVTEEVSRAMDKMNQEIIRSASGEPRDPAERARERAERRRKLRAKRREKTPEERREQHLVKGLIKMFWGGGLSIFLYFLLHALVLKLPPEVMGQIPFQIDPVVRVFWLIGLLPIFSGFGHIVAALTIRLGTKSSDTDAPQVESAEQSPLRIEPYDDEMAVVGEPRMPPASVTDRTTNILEHKLSDTAPTSSKASISPRSLFLLATTFVLQHLSHIALTGRIICGHRRLSPRLRPRSLGSSFRISFGSPKEATYEPDNPEEIFWISNRGLAQFWFSRSSDRACARQARRWGQRFE